MNEAVTAGVAGAVLAGATGAVVGAPWVASVVGGVNGFAAGRRRLYDWRSPVGVIAFVSDSTWALGTTAAGHVARLIGSVGGDPGFDADLSTRRNRFVYARGFRPRRGFAITVGNVVSGAGDTSQRRRSRLVTDHEDVHVWQARLFGPVYPLAYGAWAAGAAVVGAVVWLVRHRDRPVGKVIETYAYYCNPFEWWAYSRDGRWPPSGVLPGLGWRRPIVRSLESVGRSGS